MSLEILKDLDTPSHIADAVQTLGGCMENDIWRAEEIPFVKELANMLALYISCRCDASIYRLDGKIDAAIVAENQAERIYKRLPNECQW